MHESNPDNLPACMGGFCDRREMCAQYHAADTREPVERLCAAGDQAAFMPTVPRARAFTNEFASALEAF